MHKFTVLPDKTRGPKGEYLLFDPDSGFYNEVPKESWKIARFDEDGQRWKSDDERVQEFLTELCASHPESAVRLGNGVCHSYSEPLTSEELAEAFGRIWPLIYQRFRLKFPAENFADVDALMVEAIESRHSDYRHKHPCWGKATPTLGDWSAERLTLDELR